MDGLIEFSGKAAFAAWRKEERMPSPSFFLDAQLRFHDKWLKIDLQVNEAAELAHAEFLIPAFLLLIIILRITVSHFYFSN